MEAIKQEIRDELTRVRIDKGRLYDLLARIVDQIPQAPVAAPAPVVETPAPAPAPAPSPEPVVETPAPEPVVETPAPKKKATATKKKTTTKKASA